MSGALNEVERRWQRSQAELVESQSQTVIFVPTVENLDVGRGGARSVRRALRHRRDLPGDVVGASEESSFRNL